MTSRLASPSFSTTSPPHQSVRRRQRSAAASLPDRGTLRDILDDAPGEHDVVPGRFRLTDLEAYDEAAVVLGLGQIDAAVVVDRREETRVESVEVAGAGRCVAESEERQHGPGDELEVRMRFNQGGELSRPGDVPADFLP